MHQFSAKTLPVSLTALNPRRSMKRGLHSGACEAYTSALAACITSGTPIAPPSVVAVLHCNRAAAYQALDQLPEALADCARAGALNRQYTKVWCQQTRVEAIWRRLQW